MEIIIDKPPVWEQAAATFDLSGRRPIFAWDGVLYNPLEGGIDDHIVAHERVHFFQQAGMGGAAKWWERYLADAAFRLEQEIPAYRAQYASFCRQATDRNQRHEYLRHLAADLSAPFYRCDITMDRALREIKA